MILSAAVYCNKSPLATYEYLLSLSETKFVGLFIDMLALFGNK